MNKLITFIIGLCLFTISANAQHPWELGAEYSHGFGKNYNEDFFGGRYESFSKKSSFGIGLTYIISSVGKGKNSKDNGFGVYADYRYGFSQGTSGDVFGGVKAAFDFNKISGEKYTDFIPALETGYHATFNNFGKGGFATPSLTLGYDFNAKDEKAKDPYQGPVITPGIAVGYRF